MIRSFSIRFVLLAAVVTPPIYGQATNAPVDPFGRIYSARIRPEVQRIDTEAAFVRAPTAPYVLFGLGLRDSTSATNGSFSFGYGDSLSGNDIFVNGTYSRASLDSGDDRDRASAYGQIVLVPEGFATISAIATAAYDPDAFKTYGVVLAAERDLIKNKLTATANLGWAEFDPEGESAVSDVQPAIGLTFAPNDLWTLSADYTFKNDLDGEDTGSFAVSRKLPRFKTGLKLTVEKHESYALSVTRKFGFN